MTTTLYEIALQRKEHRLSEHKKRHKEKQEMRAPEVAKLIEALEGFLAIVSDSTGVAGYHLNGEIAEWREFEEVAMAEEALATHR